jgi:carboxyl-terminal processing protease
MYKKFSFTFLFVFIFICGYFVAYSQDKIQDKFFNTIFANQVYKIEDITNGSTTTVASTNFDISNSAILKEVQKHIDNKFISWKATYTLPTLKEIEQNMVAGYVNSFKDPYTQYFPPKEAKNFLENVRGSFGGVGMEVGLRDGRVTVISPLKDTPAMRAGIKAGDVVVKINSQDISNMSVEEAVSIIRGEPGTKVELTVARKTTDANKKEIIQNKDFSVTREVIKIPTIDTKLEKGVFVISLYSFSAESPELFRQALLKFTESKTNKLIIDLRGNPGGYLESSVEIASFFLPEGKTIVDEKGRDSYGQNGSNIHRSKGYNVFNNNLKLFILIDEGSASASEILAGALQDHGLAKVYGQKSYGKGSVQEFIDLSSGGALKVTIAKWYTPNGRSITEDKIVPDFPTVRTDKTTRDSELTEVINMINKK